MQEFCAAGVCPVSALGLGAHEREWLGRLCPDAQSVLVYLFPYFAGRRPGNLSLYARGRDYHAVIRDALTPVADRLCERHPAHRFAVLADDSPLPEVRAAVLAGLGAAGQNGLLIHETYGSYVVIGTIASSLPIPAAQQLPRACLGCGACVRACPARAIGAAGVDPARCLSALTQRGGDVSAEEAALLRQHPLAWGCDACQTACPMNRDVPLTETPAFRENLIDSLDADALDGLTRRAFLEKYPGRAFTWRGPAPLRRNLALQRGADTQQTENPS